MPTRRLADWARDREESVLRLFVAAAWAFWAVFSLATPVTTSDSEIYDLVRLKLALQGGLFHNPYWNSPRQIYFPWTFDAVHLPFLQLGFGFALPSFACFTGLLVILFRLVESRVGRREAWWACAALMALPTLVFQATSSKNDVAVVFALACWAYALDRHGASRQPRYLGLMALALGFAAGAKSTGIPFAAIGAVLTFGALRHSARDCGRFAAALALGLLTMGSVEIYADNHVTCGELLGPGSFVASHRNPDGVSGAGANLIRYLFGNLTLGLDHLHRGAGLRQGLEQACRSVLRALGCPDRGYGFWFNDAKLSFLKSDDESASDFGPLGGAALWFALVAAACVRPRDWVWRLSLASIASLLVICLAVGWMPWNERFLILPVVLATVALVLGILRIRSGVARALLLLVIVVSSVVFPAHSLNKNLSGLIAALRDRQAYEMREDPPMAEVVGDIRQRVAAGTMRRLALYAGGNSWTLSFFEIPGLAVHPAPNLPPSLPGPMGGFPFYLLLLNRQLPPVPPFKMTAIRSYGQNSHALLFEVTGMK